MQSIAQAPTPGHISKAQTLAIATPTQSHGPLDGASASLVAQALQQGLQQTAHTAAQRQQLGNREADGGWCLSWCKERYWGEVIAAGSGTSGVVKVGSCSSSQNLVFTNPTRSSRSTHVVQQLSSLYQPTPTRQLAQALSQLPMPSQGSRPREARPICDPMLHLPAP